MEISTIAELIKTEIPDAEIQTKDVSGAEDNLHFAFLVVSSAFENKSLLEQHRMVMNILKEKLKAEIHAVQLQTMPRSRYNAIKQAQIKTA